MKPAVPPPPDPLNDMSDEKLIDAYRSGENPDALAVLADRCNNSARNRINRLCYQMSIPYALAREAQQHVETWLLEAITHYSPNRYRGRARSFRYFMGRVLFSDLLNLVRDDRRYRKHHHPTIRADADCESAVGLHARATDLRSPAALGITQPDDDAQWQERRHIVQRVVGGLSRSERLVIHARIGELPRQIVAGELGISARTIDRRWAPLAVKLRKE